MVKIPSTFSTSRTVTSSTGSLLNINAISQVQAVTSSGISNLLEMELTGFQNKKAAADRALLVKREAEFNANLDTALPRLYSQVSLEVSKAMGAIKAIDEEERALEQKREKDIYVAKNTIELQENYVRFQEEARKVAAEDGTGYTQALVDLMNDKGEQLLQLAPNEDARLDMLKFFSKQKLEALEHGSKFEAEQRKAFRLNEVNRAVNSAQHQARTNPEIAGALMEQVEVFKEALIEDGMKKSEVNKLIENAKAQIFEGQVEGLVNQGQPDLALGVINSEASKGLLSNEKYKKLTKVVADKYGETSLALMKDADISVALSKISNGFTELDSKSQKEVQSLGFNHFVGNFMDAQGRPLQTMTQNDLNAAAVDFYGKFPGLTLAGQHKNIAERGVLFGPSDVAVSNSLMLYTLSKNEKTAFTVNGVDQSALKEATLIAQAVQTGFTPQEAVEMARKQRTVDPNVSKALTESFTLEDFTDAVGDTFENFFFINPDNADEIAVEYADLYQNLLKTTGSSQVAMDMLLPRMASTHGTTSINRQKELMRHAPDMYYRGDEYDWFEADFNRYLQDVSGFFGADPSKGGKPSLVARGADFIPFVDVENKIAFKDPQTGIDKTLEIELRDIPGITSANNLEYGIYKAGSRDLLLQSDLDPSKPDLPITYKFDRENNENYIKRQKEMQREEAAALIFKQQKARQVTEAMDLIAKTAAERGVSKTEASHIVSGLNRVNLEAFR